MDVQHKEQTNEECVENPIYAGRELYSKSEYRDYCNIIICQNTRCIFYKLSKKWEDSGCAAQGAHP